MSPGGRKLSKKRRALFLLVLVALVVALVELASRAAFRALAGEGFDSTRVSAQKAAIAGGEIPAEVQGQLSTLDVVPHPYVGYVWTRRVNANEGWVRHHESHPINEHGFMDRSDFVAKRAPKRLIVGIFGGSVAWWLSSQGDRALEERLRESPLFAEREIVFLRLGIGGYKQPQQLATLCWMLALGGELDVLINLDGFNEVVLATSENLESGVFPFFPRGWHHLMGSLPDLETKRRVGRVVYVQSERQAWARALDGSLVRRSAAAQLAWRVRDRMLAHALDAARYELQSYAPEDLPFEARGPSSAAIEQGDVYGEIAAVWARSSLQMQRLCEANGIRYLHFLQPNQYVEGSKPMGAQERRIAFEESSAFKHVRAGYPRLLEAAEQLVAEGVRFHDLRMVFADVAEPLYIDLYCHLNRLGNEMLGGIIGDYVLQDWGAAAELRGLSGLPAELELTDPAHPERLRVRAAFGDGSERALGAFTPGLAWSSSDPSVVTVAPGGELVARGVGSATITVAKDGHSASCRVVARWEPILEYDVIAGAPRLAPLGARPPRRDDHEYLLVVRDPPASGGVVAVSRERIEPGEAHRPDAVYLQLEPDPEDGARAIARIPMDEVASIVGAPVFCRAVFGQRDDGSWIASSGLVLTVLP